MNADEKGELRTIARLLRQAADRLDLLAKGRARTVGGYHQSAVQRVLDALQPDPRENTAAALAVRAGVLPDTIYKIFHRLIARGSGVKETSVIIDSTGRAVKAWRRA